MLISFPFNRIQDTNISLDRCTETEVIVTVVPIVVVAVVVVAVETPTKHKHLIICPKIVIY